jgi:sugar lactone lactonase YvrE
VSPRAITSQVFVGENYELGEGPFWFEQRLWWVNIGAGELHSVDGQGKNPTCLTFDRKVGAVAPTTSGNFIAALQDGIALVDRASGNIEMLASPERDRTTNRFNDGKCDPAGRFVAGTLSMVGERGVAALYSVEKDGNWKSLRPNLVLSNGLAWTADGSILYHVDSLAYEITRFPYDLATGEIGEGKVVLRIPPELGVPDGMDIDVDGNLWVAHWGGNSVRCWSPVTGECLAEVSVPASQPSSCCFGGSGLSRLFITSAREGMSPEALQKQPYAGCVFVCDPGTSGQPVRRFAA